MSASSTVGDYLATTPGPPPGITCAVYVRLSATEQQAVRRARAQKSEAAAEAELRRKVREHLADCLDFAEEHGYHVPAELQFVEANLTASIRGTKALPERERMLAWVHTCKGPVYVLSTEAARFFRDVKRSQEMVGEAKRLIRQNPKAKLHILTVGGKDYDLTDADGLATFNTDMAAAQGDADRSSQRARRKKHRRARAGYYSGWRPFGYDKISDRDDDGEYTAEEAAERPLVDLAVRPAEAEAIKAAGARVIAAAAAGEPVLYQIAAEWNAAGLLTARGGKWTGHKVGDMLRNPLRHEHPDAPGRGIRTELQGNLYGRPGRDDDGNAPEPDVWVGRHEALFPVATAAALLAALNREGRPGGDGGHLLKYPLSGLAVCGKCGGRLRAAPAYGGQRQLTCPSPPAGCGGIGRIMGPVEDWVREVVFWWLRPGGDFDTATQQAQTARSAGDHTVRLAEIDAAAAVHAAGLAEFEDQVFTGDFGPGVTRDMAARLAERHRRAAAALATERDELIRQATAAAAPVPDREIDWSASTPEARRDWLGNWVAKVIIHPTRKGMAAFDLAKIEIVPAGWAGGREVTWPDVPALVPRAIAAAPRGCDLPGCGRTHQYGPPGAGLCGMHRRRQLAAIAAGHPDTWDRSPARKPGKAYHGRTCDLPGCGRPHAAGGLCAMHGTRQRKAAAAGHPGEWDRGGPKRGFVPGLTCGLPGCGRPLVTEGLCNMHRQRRDRAARAGHPGEWDRTPRP